MKWLKKVWTWIKEFIKKLGIDIDINVKKK